MGSSYDALARLRGLRKSIAAARAKAAAGATQALDEADARAKKLESGETAMAGVGRRRAGGGLAGVNGRLGAILNAMDGADAAPTAAERDAAERLRNEAEGLIAEARQLEASLPKLNASLRRAGVPEVRAEAYADDADSESREGAEIE
jgi:hypothetical protein